jgi:hypothetical protein
MTEPQCFELTDPEDDDKHEMMFSNKNKNNLEDRAYSIIMEEEEEKDELDDDDDKDDEIFLLDRNFTHRLQDDDLEEELPSPLAPDFLSSTAPPAPSPTSSSSSTPILVMTSSTTAPSSSITTPSTSIPTQISAAITLNPAPSKPSRTFIASQTQKSSPSPAIPTKAKKQNKSGREGKVTSTSDRPEASSSSSSRHTSQPKASKGPPTRGGRNQAAAPSSPFTSVTLPVSSTPSATSTRGGRGRGGARAVSAIGEKDKREEKPDNRRGKERTSRKEREDKERLARERRDKEEAERRNREREERDRRDREDRDRREREERDRRDREDRDRREREERDRREKEDMEKRQRWHEAELNRLERVPGGKPTLSDSYGAVFAHHNVFQVGEMVLVPRSRGGFTYGKIASCRQRSLSCASITGFVPPSLNSISGGGAEMSPPEGSENESLTKKDKVCHTLMEWRVTYPSSNKATQQWMFKDLAASFIGKIKTHIETIVKPEEVPRYGRKTLSPLFSLSSFPSCLFAPTRTLPFSLLLSIPLHYPLPSLPSFLVSSFSPLPCSKPLPFFPALVMNPR